MLSKRLPLALLTLALLGCPEPEPTPTGGGGGATGGGGAVGGGMGGGSAGGGSAGGGGATGGGGGGGETGGGGGATGGGGGATGGGGGATGGGGGGTGPSGLTICNAFEQPRSLAEAEHATLAVLDNGDVVYAWRSGDSVFWRVQQANGTFLAEVEEAHAGAVVAGPVLSARGNQLLSVHAASNGSDVTTYTRRYSAGTWGAVTALGDDQAQVSALWAWTDSSGAAKVWQQVGFMELVNEYVSTGAGAAFGAASEVMDGGFVYFATGSSMGSMVAAIKDFTGPVDLAFRDQTDTYWSTLPDSFYDPASLYLGAAASDGALAWVAGHYAVDGGAAFGVMSGGAPVPLSATFPLVSGMGVPFRGLGLLTASADAGLAVWVETGSASNSIHMARFTSAGFAPAQVVVADADLTIPRFFKLTDTQGMVHFVEQGGGPQYVQVDVSGQVGPVTPSNALLTGVVTGTQYAGSATTAAAIGVTGLSDGGLEYYSSQCR